MFVKDIPLAAELLGPGGILREVRDPQVRMGKLVERALNDRRNAMVEAGTGTGKTFGYVIPLLTANAGIEPATISTATIALQEQIFTKDLPFLKEALLPYGIHFDFALAKGRNNYVSKRRLNLAMRKSRQVPIGGHTPRAAAMIAQLDAIAQLDQARIGDKGSYGWVPDPAVWSKVQSDSDHCEGNKCPFFMECHFHGARSMANTAKIVVTNHALLSQDIALGRGLLLPAHKNVVVDEAHQWWDSVFKAHTSSIRTGQAARLLKDIEAEFPGYISESLNHRMVNCESQLLAIAERTMGRESSVLLTDAPSWVVNELTEIATLVFNSIPDEEYLAKLQSKVARYLQPLRIMQNPRPSDIVWAEVTRFGVAIHAGTIDVGHILQQTLYPTAAVIHTSATIAKGDQDFSEPLLSLGLEKQFAAVTGQFGSPFDFRQQAMLYVPSHLPEPSKDDPMLSARAVADEMLKLVIATKGRAFLLFTSGKGMNTVYEMIAAQIDAAGYPVVKQGDMPKRDMLRWFSETKGAVLFGLSSFWEGVSIEGDQLSLVAIDKIPFPVPSDPIYKKREEAIEKLGGSGFAVLSMSEAIQKLKQGFGRLIRTQDDKGIVAILDARIRTKGYGRNILRALPSATRVDRFPTPAQIAQFIR